MYLVVVGFALVLALIACSAPQHFSWFSDSISNHSGCVLHELNTWSALSQLRGGGSVRRCHFILAAQIQVSLLHRGDLLAMCLGT